jgi:hypothetical protein
MNPDLPSRIDRAAIERVIQRAAELQTGERDLSEGMTAEEVVALGREVGIPDRYLQQALLEERSRTLLDRPGGFLDRALGPRGVAAQRVVRGELEQLEDRLLRWMEDQELLTLQRRQGARISWEPLRGVQAAVRRSAALFSGTRPYMLSRASLVTASVTGLEPGFCHVALGAELGETRGAHIGGIAALAGIGLAGSAILAVMSPFWLLAAAPVPFALGAGYAVGRQFRNVAERTRIGLERALDHLERGEVKPSHALPPRSGALGAIITEVRKALNP